MVSVDLLPVRLQAGQLSDLSPIVKEATAKLNLDSAGLEIRYDGQPGDVIVRAESVSPSVVQIFSVPMLDPETLASSAGGLP